MPKYPYMSFPFPYYNNRRIPKSPLSSAPYYSESQNSGDLKREKQIHFDNNKNYSDFSNVPNVPSATDTSNLDRSPDFGFLHKKNKSNNSNDYLFDLFGLKIYTDDVLLVSLIYFLYSEGVKDEGLFIVLILLLLS